MNEERFDRRWRALGACNAVSFDRLCCELQHEHPGTHHETHQGGALCQWPDSERDAKLSAEREDQIIEGLKSGVAWQPYRESFCDD